MHKRLVATLALAAVALAACSSGGAEPAASASGSSSPQEGTAAMGLTDDAVVTFSFQDSSVPPQYHRSYQLTVRADESRIVVDSYGDVLADETVPTDPAVWAALGEGMAPLVDLTADTVEQGCTGGTTTSLVVEEAGAPVIDLYLDQCAGANEAPTEAIRAWIAPARDQFPPMSELAPEGE